MDDDETAFLTTLINTFEKRLFYIKMIVQPYRGGEIGQRVDTATLKSAKRVRRRRGGRNQSVFHFYIWALTV
jgi:hypothetical protein